MISIVATISKQPWEPLTRDRILGPSPKLTCGSMWSRSSSRIRKRCKVPEGPEVLLSAELIRPLVIGRTITAAYSTRNSRYGDSRGNMWLGNLLGDYDRLAHYLDPDEEPLQVRSIKTKGKFM